MRRITGRRALFLSLLGGSLLIAAFFIGRYRESVGHTPLRDGGDSPATPARAAAPDSTPSSPETRIRVAAFNIQVFGKTKAGRPEVMSVLARIAREFELLAVQEVRDATGNVPRLFLERINSEPGPRYAMFEGPRLGRSNYQEQYVLYYLPERVELLGAEAAPDPHDLFEREPLLAEVRAGQFDFLLLLVHVKPDAAREELAALARLAADILAANPEEQDLVLLGDFNADCSYFPEAAPHPLRSPAFHWIITDDMDSSVAPSSCAYDRIVLLEGTIGREYVPGSAGVFRFDREYALGSLTASSVSDHYPVYAEFRTSLPDDD